MRKFNFLSKNLIDTFTYTTITQDRSNCTTVKINGRKYVKFGTDQAITFVGSLFEDDSHNRLLLVGISKQHPCDSKCDKDIAYCEAQTKSFVDPDLVFYTVPKYLTKFNFRKMMEWYTDAVEFEFIKTKEEIESTGDDPKIYNR